MMGRSHALSGLVTWLGGCAITAAAGASVADHVIATGAVVSAGFALLPDLDHPGSTVSRTLGPVTEALSGMVSRSAVMVRASSCRHCASRPFGGHRGLTHTAAGSAFTGLLVTACATIWPRIAALIVVGFGVWLAAHTALSSRQRARIGDMVLPGRFRYLSKGTHRFAAAVGSLLLAVAAAFLLVDPAVTSWWWLGAAVAWGCTVHSLGDALTYSAVPLCWPVRIRGCRWTAVGTPRWMRFRTGSRAETAVVVLLLLAGAGSVAVLSGAL